MKMEATTLSDGTVLKFSTRGRTGYLGSCVSTAWTFQTPDTPFIAHHNKTGEFSLEDLDQAPGRSNHHLGFYADSREAAYVAAKFDEAPEQTLEFLLSGGEFEFPADLYQQPVFLSVAGAWDLAVQKRDAKKAKAARTVTVKASRPKVKAEFPARSVNENRGLFTKLCKAYDVDALYNKYGSKAVTDARNLRLDEFLTLFGL